MILHQVELKANDKRFCLELSSINHKILTIPVMKQLSPHIIREASAVFDSLYAALFRIESLLLQAPLEEWLTSDSQKERDFALTWLRSETVDQLERCIKEGTPVSIPVYHYGKVVCYYGSKG